MVQSYVETREEACELLTMGLTVKIVRNVIVIIEVFFFFQAEDGILDADVTGVQTCALPILIELNSFAVVIFQFLTPIIALLAVYKGSPEKESSTKYL